MRNNKIKLRRGVTISEVLIASALLIMAIVPILKALASAQAATTTVDHKTNSLMLAKAKMEDIRGRAIYSYSSSYSASSLALSGSYLCNVTDSAVNSNLRRITVFAGYDANGDKILSNEEIQITLDTLIARRL
jgi:Tfp pilus assembly protein PilV